MRLCFYACDPPLREWAYGNHGVARHFVDLLRAESPVVLTQRKRRSIDVDEISSVCGDLPLWLHPSASSLGLRRLFPTLASVLDALIFVFWLPTLSARLRKAKIDRVFVLCGSDAWFLINIWLIQRLGIPVDVYWVDDIEESSDQWPLRILKFLIHPLLRSVLNKSARNFAISSGFTESISKHFGVTAEWLPLPAPEFTYRTRDFVPCAENRRHLVFIGAINRLYEDSLRELYDEICLFNADQTQGYSLVLEIISYASTTSFIESLPNRNWVVSYERLTDAELQAHLHRAYACFLPYSFAASEKRMVSTSFSCKILEYFKCQRPILVFGPDYASIPRYFRDLNLPLCATSREELRQELRLIESFDSLELTQGYYAAWERFHSPAAIRSILFQTLVPPTAP
jgi:hypothetical protein